MEQRKDAAQKKKTRPKRKSILDKLKEPKKKISFSDLLQVEGNKESFLKLFFFSILLFVCTFAAFFSTRTLVDGTNLEKYMDAISAAVAVMTANIIIGLYSLQAFYLETTYWSKEEKIEAEKEKHE